MPEYPFQLPDGQIIHRVYSMKDAPSIGTVIDIDGQPCKRIASDCIIDGDPLSKRYPHVSYTLPRSIDAKDAPQRDRRGHVICKDHAHEKMLAEKYGYAFD